MVCRISWQFTGIIEGFLTIVRIGLVLNIAGTLMIVFSFGKNLADANQVGKGRKVYLASFLHHNLFYAGCCASILRFFCSL